MWEGRSFLHWVIIHERRREQGAHWGHLDVKDSGEEEEEEEE